MTYPTSNPTTSTLLNDAWWTTKGLASAVTPIPTTPPTVSPAAKTPPAAPARPRRALPDDATMGRIRRAAKVQPLTFTERVFGPKHTIAPKQDFVAVWGSTYHKQNLISLEDAQSRPAIRLRSIQHLCYDLPMTDFPGVKLLSLEDAGASKDIKYRTVL